MKCLKSFLLFCAAICCLGTNSNAYNGPINLPLLKDMGTTSSFHPRENRFVGGGVPDSVLHGLRMFDWLLTCDSSWANLTHHDGASGAYDLTTATCSVFTELPPYHQSSFKIFDYAMFPTLALLDRGDAHEQAFDMMVSKVENEYNAQYYLLVGMQINPENNSVVYKVELHLPRDSAFAGMNSTLENMFEAQILAAAENYHNENPAFAELGNSERAAISELQWLLYQFFHGEFSGGMSESLLLMNGFRELKTMTNGLTNTTQQSILSDSIKDYSGIFIDSVSLLSVLEGAMGYSSHSVKVIMTDNNNYSNGGQNDFEEATGEFKVFSQKLVLWVHFFTNQSNQITKIFYKADNNIEESEGDELINSTYAHIKYGNGNSPRPTIANGNLENRSDCPVFYLSSSWKAKEHLLPCIEEMNIYGAVPIPIEAKRLVGGVICGVVDGVMETLNLVIDLALGIQNTLEHVPLSGQWFVSLIDHIWKQEGFFAGIKSQLNDDLEYWENFYKDVTEFISYISECYEYILSQMVEELLGWVDTVTLQNGYLDAGYGYGKVIFNIIVAYFTGGYKQMADMAKLTASSIKSFTTFLKNPTGLRDLMAAGIGAADDVGKAVIKVCVEGCFVQGTLVATAAGQFPINSLSRAIKPNTDIDMSFLSTFVSIIIKN